MLDGTLDESALFDNFYAPTENEDAVSAEIKALRKHLKKDKPNAKPRNEPDGDVSSQKKYITELEQQNSKLKAIVKRLLGPQAFTMNDAVDADDDSEIDLIKKLDDNIQSKPFAIVLFMNNDISTVHRKEIDDLMSYLSEKDVRQDVLLADKLQAQNSAIPVKAFAANCNGRRFNLPKRGDVEDPYVISAFQYYKSFYIDRMGAALLENIPGGTNIWNVPTYEQMYMRALPIMEESFVRVKQMKRCFNCDGDHNLNECPEPRDQQKINMNRQQFSASKMNSSGYGQGNDDELNEKYKHFKPGELSVGLEEALDISLKKHLPPYIYKMRLLGYPPAYLKPTEEGLKIYGPDGETMREPDAEDGEIKGPKLPDVISYPGYNAAIPEGVRDEAEKMGLPPFHPEEADLYIAMKRAQALGFIDDTEPLAKRLKFDEINMDVNGVSAITSTTPTSLIEEVQALPRSPRKDGKEEIETPNKDKKSSDSSKDKGTKDKSKEIDETTYRNWFNHKPLTSVGVIYVMYTPPPTCRCEVDWKDLPKNPVTDLDREPWKTASTSWYDPLYGDLAAPTGTYDAIRTLLKDTKRVKPKPMV